MEEYYKDNCSLIIRRLEGTNNKFRLKLIQDEINKFIDSLSIKSNKLEFLETLKESIDSKNSNHKINCENEECFIEQKYNTCLFFIRQIKDKIEKEEKQNITTYIENFNIDGHGQILNFGTVNDKIINNTTILESQGKDQISKSLENLTNAVLNDNTMGSEDKNLILENLELLSEEALKDKTNRLPKNVFKNIFAGLNTLSSIATISGFDFKQVLDYFMNS